MIHFFGMPALFGAVVNSNYRRTQAVAISPRAPGSGARCPV